MGFITLHKRCLLALDPAAEAIIAAEAAAHDCPSDVFCSIAIAIDLAAAAAAAAAEVEVQFAPR